MPSTTTSIVTMRVKNRVRDDFESMCSTIGHTKAEVLGMFVRLWSEGSIVYGNNCMEINIEPSDNRDRVHRDLDRFIEILTEKGYPDAAIGVYTEQIVRKAKDMERYKRR